MGYKTVYKEGVQKRLHRVLVEEHLGRELRNDEIVHHKDGNKLNNCLENLEVMNKIDHAKLHGQRDEDLNI